MLHILQNGVKELLGRELSTDQLAQFELYYQEMVDWNSRINLTAITDYDAVQLRHFLDSLTLASPRLRGETNAKPLDLDKARLVDIGAGAGFPGLPLKILYPGLGLTLVDSVGKKTAFLSHLAARLGFEGVTVITGRAEELGQSPEHRERYDLATGRAVAAWPVLAEYCLPLCRVGGIFAAPKKGGLEIELSNAVEVARKLGAVMREAPEFQLPGETESRRLVIAQKKTHTPKLYPRRTGLPSKEPLS